MILYWISLNALIQAIIFCKLAVCSLFSVPIVMTEKIAFETSLVIYKLNNLLFCWKNDSSVLQGTIRWMQYTKGKKNIRVTILIMTNTLSLWTRILKLWFICYQKHLQFSAISKFTVLGSWTSASQWREITTSKLLFVHHAIILVECI